MHVREFVSVRPDSFEVTAAGNSVAEKWGVPTLSEPAVAAGAADETDDINMAASSVDGSAKEEVLELE